MPSCPAPSGARRSRWPQGRRSWAPHRSSARPRRGEVERLRALSRDINQFRNGVGGKRFVGDERDRLGGDHADRREILLGVIGQLCPMAGLISKELVATSIV